jgi:hypothetical protein
MTKSLIIIIIKKEGFMQRDWVFECCGRYSCGIYQKEVAK